MALWSPGDSSVHTLPSWVSRLSARRRAGLLTRTACRNLWHDGEFVLAPLRIPGLEVSQTLELVDQGVNSGDLGKAR